MKIHHFSFTLLFLLFITRVSAQSPIYSSSSVQSFQGVATQGVSGYYLTKTLTDADDNVYSFGYMEGPSVQFGNITLINSSQYSYFIVKFDSEGTVLWARIIDQGTFSGYMSNISLDGLGNIVMTGVKGGFSDLVTLDFSIIGLTSENSLPFVVKYSGTTGEYMWHKAFGTLESFPLEPVLDNNIILTKQFDDTGNTLLCFTTSAPTFTIGSTTFESDLRNFIYSGQVVIELNNQGDIVSTFQVTGDAAHTNPLAITAVSGKVYITGEIYTSFQEDIAYYNFILPGTHNMFVAEFETNGNIVWATSAGGLGSAAYPSDIYSTGNELAITGIFLGTPMFGGTTTLSASGGNDVFTIKYDAFFNLLWGKKSGGSFSEVPGDIVIDSEGSIITAFNLNSTTSSLQQFVITKYNVAGNIVWADTLQNSVFITDLSVVFDDNIHICGGFTATVTIGNVTLTSNPTYIVNNFVARIISIPTKYWTGNVSSNWFDENNWLPQQIPTLADNVELVEERPHYPALSDGNEAECGKLVIIDGAKLVMNGGLLDVWGEITANSSDAFELKGGTLNLRRGSNFPENMYFHNLYLTNFSNVYAENIYKFPGTVTVTGNLKLIGTNAEPGLPAISMEENDYMLLNKNLSIVAGSIGYIGDINNITDKKIMPKICFCGTENQKISVDNIILNPPLIHTLDCTVEINNSNAKFIGTDGRIAIFNLILYKDFDLAGKDLVVRGKIVHWDYETATVPPNKILNSVPSVGTLETWGDSEWLYDDLEQKIYIDKLRKLMVNRFNFDNGRAVLEDDLIVDSLEVTGRLTTLDKNLTIGSVNSSRGFLDCDTLYAGVEGGTLSLLGNDQCPQYELNAVHISNLTLNNPAGVKLNNRFSFPETDAFHSKMNLFGVAELVNGDFDLNGCSVVLINFSGFNAEIIETDGNTFVTSFDEPSSNVSIEKTFSQTIANNNIGGLGFTITSNVPLNEMLIQRNPLSQTGANGGASINRIFSITNQSPDPNLNALIKIKYDESELLGIDENDLVIFRNVPGTVNDWEAIPSSVNTQTNVVTALAGLNEIAVDDIGYYTLAAASNPMRKGQFLEEQPETLNDNVIVYPNPFTNQLKVDFNSTVAENATVKVVDIAGRLLKEETAQLIEGNCKINICCMNELPAGMYFLHINSSQTNTITKVLKN